MNELGLPYTELYEGEQWVRTMTALQMCADIDAKLKRRGYDDWQIDDEHPIIADRNTVQTAFVYARADYKSADWVHTNYATPHSYVRLNALLAIYDQICDLLYSMVR